MQTITSFRAHLRMPLHAHSCNRLQSLLLLAIRLYWGWQFAQDGWGKLTHLARVTEFFAIAQPSRSGCDCGSGRVGRVCWRHPVRVRLCIATGLAGPVREHDDGLPERP